jgi:hypothetical protein
MPKEGEGHERADRPNPSPSPSSGPAAPGYVKDRPSNEVQDRQLKDLGIGPGGRDTSKDKGSGGDKHGGPPDRGDIRN